MSRLINEYEELQRCVKTKLVAADKQLVDAANLLKSFYNKHQGGRLVFTETLDYYVNELKFDYKKVMKGLE